MRSLSSFVFVFLFAGALCAQESIENRLQRLEKENQRILKNLEDARTQNAHLEMEVKTLREETKTLIDQSPPVSPLEIQLNGLLVDDADVGWTRATKSGLPIRFYGFIRLDTYYNTARATDPIIPFAVLPQDSSQNYDSSDDQFAFDSRLTRIGIDIDGGSIGSADVTAKIEIDFANFFGVQESRETPRIRLAYVDVDFGSIALRFGQDWDVIAPLVPSVHAEFALWGAGNVGDRRPMVQLSWHKHQPSGFDFQVEIAAGFQGSVDGRDHDGLGGRTNLDGINAGIPHGQIRLGASFDSWVEAKRGSLGIYGYVGQIQSDSALNGHGDFDSWMVGIDIELPLFGPISFRSEAWVGQALSDIRGTILMDVNSATGKEIRGWGGWAELHAQVTDNLRLAFGGSIDDPRDSDVNPAILGESRRQNFTFYVSSRLDLGGGLLTGLDVIYWQTDWGILGDADLVRVNWWIQLNF